MDTEQIKTQWITKEGNKCNTIIKHMQGNNKIIKKHNPNRPKNPDHSYRILIVGGSGTTNSLLIL